VESKASELVVELLLERIAELERDGKFPCILCGTRDPRGSGPPSRRHPSLSYWHMRSLSGIH
jgi:hypothetical protein